MCAQVLGISGSPVTKSNTDRLIKAVLAASGLHTEFVKLSNINVRGCVACLGCAGDNICKQTDDFATLGPKVKMADALVIGGYSPYDSIDSFTKAFLERLFSLRHRTGLNRGKLAVVITTGIGRGRKGVHEANEQIVHALVREGMEVIGSLEAIGNPVCLSCGYGEGCPMSAIPFVFGSNATITPDKFSRVEDQSGLWNRAQELGNQLGAAVRSKLAQSA